MKNQPCVVVTKDGIVKEVILCRDEDNQKDIFLKKIKENVPSFNDITIENISEIIDQGYLELIHDGSICLANATKA